MPSMNIETIGSLSEILFMKLLAKPQHTGATNTSKAPVENLKFTMSSLDRRMQAKNTTNIPTHRRGEIFCLNIISATNEVITISKLLNKAAFEAEINFKPNMLHAIPTAFKLAIAKTKGKSLLSNGFSFTFGLNILRKTKKTLAQSAAPIYKRPPEKTGPIVLLFNNSFEIGVLIDEHIAAMIAKTIPT